MSSLSTLTAPGLAAARSTGGTERLAPTQASRNAATPAAAAQAPAAAASATTQFSAEALARLDAVGDGWQRAVDQTTQGWHAAVDGTRQAWDSAVRTVSDAAQQVELELDHVSDRVGHAVSDAGHAVADGARAVANGVANGAADYASVAGRAVAGLFTGSA